MGESTGQIVFINSHDYVSDISGTPFIGCLANLLGDDGSDVALYTRSPRLQHTLEMAYATKARVAVDYFDEEVSVDEQRGLDSTATRREPSSDSPGLFTLKALWTLE